ncbi:TspO/MBR family protein [[Mycobacterium] wendilense]|uniref:TspO/MBR family protein n=1 Tax=[Mycobacterium] wendilense TaxID=3064284 RepID=A0ABM9ME05_9MYCO|nr:TspO/MBR family protein [Mycolicibacterium sp. MU0050]CAJ1582941.1 TspO/MBR family protein [Mycolicibacterium sp. MU0050]
MKVKTLGATAAAVAATAIAGSAATSSSVKSPWYARLRKPSYQPPPKVFPIVWPLLYTDIAVVSTDTIDGLTNAGGDDAARAYRTALGINLVLNAGWSWVFFNRRRPGLAALTAGALTASSADLTRRAVTARGLRAAPLAAYPAWCAFATVLSSHIWWLNRR